MVKEDAKQERWEELHRAAVQLARASAKADREHEIRAEQLKRAADRYNEKKAKR
jgi:hypothetical protein